MNNIIKVIAIVLFVIALLITNITGSPEKGSNFFTGGLNFIIEPIVSRVSHKVEKIGNVYNSQVTKNNTATSTNINH